MLKPQAFKYAYRQAEAYYIYIYIYAAYFRNFQQLYDLLN
jgi:hypothetical protein